MKKNVTKKQIRRIAEGAIEKIQERYEEWDSLEIPASDEPEPDVDDLDDLCYDEATDSLVPCEDVGREEFLEEDKPAVSLQEWRREELNRRVMGEFTKKANN